MKFIAFASAALVSAATLTGAASAAGLVPGSDHFRDEAADRATHSVALSEPARVSGSIRETRSFGYPARVGAAAVPGSESASRARDAAEIDAVVRSAPGAGLAATQRVPGILVPGSDTW